MSQTLSVKVQLENIEQANAGLAKLGQSATTAGDQLATAGQKGTKFGQDITSSMQPLQNVFSNAQTGMQKFSQETLQTQQSTFRLTGSLEQMGQALPGVGTGLNETGSAMGELVTNTGRFEQGMASATGETSNFTGALSGIGDSMGQLAGDANSLGGALSSISADTGGLDSLTGSAQELTSSFDSLRPSVEGIASPLSEMGGSFDTLTGAMTGAASETTAVSDAFASMGTEVTGVQGGLTEANTLLGDYSDKAVTAGDSNKGFASSAAGMIGSLTAMSALAINFVRGLSNISNSQTKVQRSNLMASKSAEMLRKAQLDLNKVMDSATSNTAGIAAARDKLAAAQDNLNQMLRDGVTGGQELEAAQKAVTESSAALVQELVAGGVAGDKAAAAVNNLALKTEQKEIADRRAADAAQDHNLNMANLVSTSIGMGGAMVSALADVSFLKEGLGKLKGAITGISPAAKGMVGSISGMAIGLAGAALVLTAMSRDVGGLQTQMTEWTEGAKKAVPQLAPLFDHMAKSIHSNAEAVDGLLVWLGILPPKVKEVEKAEKDLSAAVVDTSKNFKEAITATQGSTTAMGALQRTNAEAQITQADFNTALAATKKEMDAGGASTDTLTQSMYKFYDAMTQTADQALTLSNLFPELDANIQNALLGQEQGLTVGIQLWNDFNERVKAGQYEVGEFSKYIEDMGYTLGPAIQSGVDKISEITAKIEEARATIPGYIEEVTTAIMGETDAISAEAEALDVSNKALEHSRQVRGDAAASAQVLHTALNNTLKGLYDEEAALQASIAATQSSVIQKQALSNATLEGVKSAHEWVAGLDEAQAKEQAEISTLQQYASRFGELPSVIEPTVSSLHGFIAANEQGGQAAIDFQQTVLDAYNSLVSEAQGLFDSLTAAIQESGKEQAEGMKAAWDDLLPGVEAALTGSEKMAIESFSRMQAELERGVEAFQTKLQAGLIRGLSLDQATDLARGTFQSFLTEAQSESGTAWNGIWDEAQTIAATGSAEMINAAAKAIQEGKVPAEVEKMLQSIIQKGEPAGKKFGASLGQGIISGVKASASAIAGAMASASAGVDLGAAKKGATAAAPKLPTVAQQAPIKIDADITPAAAKLQTLVATIASIRQSAPIPINADVNPAASALQSLVATISSIRQSAPIPINADVNPAATALQSLVATISSIRQSAPIPVLVDTQQATTMITGLTTLITSIVQAAPIPIMVDTQPSTIMLTGLQTLITSIKQATPPTIAVNNATAISQITVVQTKIDQIKQKTPPSIQLNITPAIQQTISLQNAINNIKQKTPPSLTVNIQQGLNAVNQLQNKINSLKGKNVTNTVTTQYRTVGSPAVGGRQHGGSFIATNSTKIGGVSIAEYNKPELVTVTPLTNPDDASDRNINKTIKVPSARAEVPNSRFNGAGGEGSGGGQPLTIHNHLHMNEREIGSIITKHTANIGNKRGRHFR